MEDNNKKDKNTEERMALTLRGIIILAAGLLVMILGFVIMTGGGSDNPNVFNEAMFDARRLVVAPLTIILGVIIEIVAIMGWFPKKKIK